MDKIKVGDILYFDEYIFTDNNSTAKHFALVVLPQLLFVENIYCAVITKQTPRNNLLIKLDCDNYSCFSVVSYACMDRIDIERIEKGNHRYRASLTVEDLRKGLKVIRKCIALNHPCYKNKLFTATVIREWKKQRDLLTSI